MLLFVFFCIVIAQPSYMQLERYETLPKFVSASSFGQITGDKIEIMLRQMISYTVFNALTGTRRDPTHNPLQNGLDIGFNNHDPVSAITYRALRTVHGELLTRGLTFSCNVLVQNEYVYAPFTEVDPFGPMPIAIRLLRANITTAAPAH